jgi:thiamine-phosphate diphosphorylase
MTAHIEASRREIQAGKLRGLYVIIDPATTPRDPEEVAAAALRGGACAIQWRDKLRDKGDQLPVCQRLTELCARHDALFIVNDHADLARACGAHGLHLGQHDLPLAHARPLLAADQIIGRSNATVEEAADTQDQGADYIAVGAIFPTGTKTNTRPAGLETLRRVRTMARLPIVAIGGISEANAGDVIAAGADAVAVISAVAGADDPEEAARRLTDRIQAALAARGAA